MYNIKTLPAILISGLLIRCARIILLNVGQLKHTDTPFSLHVTISVTIHTRTHMEITMLRQCHQSASSASSIISKFGIIRVLSIAHSNWEGISKGTTKYCQGCLYFKCACL